MNAQRTGPMIAIGIISIVFGSLWCIGALLTVLGGGLLAAVGSAAEQDLAGQPGQAAAFGGAMILLGLFALIIGATLLISGIGVISVKPWGRNLSLAAAALWIVNTLGQAVLLGAIGIGTIVSLVYPLVLLGLFLSPKWTAAFTAQPGSINDGLQTAPANSNDPDQFRHAA